MNKLIILLTLILGLYLPSKSQNLKKFEVTTMPLSLIDIGQPHFRIGTKFFLSEKIALGTDIGIANDYLYYLNDAVSDYKYYSIRLEIDYSIIRTEQFNLYSGIEYYYYKRQNKLEHSYIELNDGELIIFDGADYLKLKEGLNLKLGLSIYIKNFFVDFYAGAGYRRKYVEYSYINNGTYSENHLGRFGYRNRIGFVQGFNISAGLKAGFRF
ncbi:MAG: hypothetical protein JXL97_15570 [Bacteroidales bacterium]|nr:hypothetical protein [Bacteroidales bacterium]